VQAVVYPKTDDEGNEVENGCLDSEIAVWNVDENAETEINSVAALSEPPEVEDIFTVEESEDEYLFKLSDDDDRKLAVQIMITDENDELKEIRYEVTDFSLPKEAFSYVQDEVTVTQIVQVRFAELSDSGISEWTVWYELQSDGMLTEKEDVGIQTEELSIEEAVELWQNRTDEIRREAAEEVVNNASETDADEDDENDEE
jgi:hypothetical protein